MQKFILILAAALLSACTAPRGERDEVRNVIFMIGDGMGLAHVSMLQIGNDFAQTSFDRAEGVALITTRSANNRVTDSSAAGTALSSGYKTANSMLGVDTLGEAHPSMMALAARAGRPTGVVVTCFLQHATPGAFYAHAASRGDTEGITRDLLDSRVDVLMGGGSEWLDAACGEDGTYFDAFRSRGYCVASSIDEADTLRAEKLLAVVAPANLPRAAERGDFLPRATAKALELLDERATACGEGFLLMVEGSQIDYAAHANDAAWLLEEMRDFDRAVAVAMDFADRTPRTLVVVTADHETGGLALCSGNEDFTLPESGVECRFATGGHSGTMVPVYLYGTGADRIRGVMDNTDLSRRIMELTGLHDK